MHKYAVCQKRKEMRTEMKKDDLAKNYFSVQDILAKLQDSMVLRQEMPDGSLEMTIYHILPGIYLVLNNVHTAYVPCMSGSTNDTILTVNYCLEGRCEFQLPGNNYSYVDQHMSSIGTLRVQDSFYYPSAYYLGYEIYLYYPLFTQETRQILQLFSIDPELLFSKYRNIFLASTPAPLARIWEDLYAAREHISIGKVRLQTLHILQYLTDETVVPQVKNMFLTKTQAGLAKRLKEILTENLSEHRSVRSVADCFGISETSLKNYFRLVYGQNISQFLNEERMKLAAELLATTSNSVSDIAKACGYVNQGRFAKLFKKYHHMKPLDYRRNAALQHTIK